ncbi:hypothetical protein GGI35DRAFT_433958 [Trichoderma velutinum]
MFATSVLLTPAPVMTACTGSYIRKEDFLSPWQISSTNTPESGLGKGRISACSYLPASAGQTVFPYWPEVHAIINTSPDDVTEKR